MTYDISDVNIVGQKKIFLFIPGGPRSAAAHARRARPLEADREGDQGDSPAPCFFPAPVDMQAKIVQNNTLVRFACRKSTPEW
jgi:hypothetical protein